MQSVEVVVQGHGGDGRGILEDGDHHFPPDSGLWSPWRDEFRADKLPSGEYFLNRLCDLDLKQRKREPRASLHLSVRPFTRRRDDVPGVDREGREESEPGGEEEEEEEDRRSVMVEIDRQSGTLETLRLLTWFSTLRGSVKVINCCWIKLTYRCS